MRGIYTIELEGKFKENSVFLSDAMLKDGMFGLDGLFTRAIDQCHKGQIDTIVIYLCTDDDLLNIWEFSVAAHTAQQKLFGFHDNSKSYRKHGMVEQIRKYIEKLEGKKHGSNRNRKTITLPEPSKV